MCIYIYIGRYICRYAMLLCALLAYLYARLKSHMAIYVCRVTVFLLFVLFLWRKEGRGAVWPDPLQRAERAERAKASEASQSSWMRAFVYLKLGNGQTEQPHITQTKQNDREPNMKTVRKTDKILGLGTADRGASRHGGVVQGLLPKDNKKS